MATGVANGGSAPGLQIKENMFGDAIVEIDPADEAAAAEAKVDPRLQEKNGNGCMRTSDSWQLTGSSEGKKGMHVTFQVCRITCWHNLETRAKHSALCLPIHFTR
jgi:hypothetical protein